MRGIKGLLEGLIAQDKAFGQVSALGLVILFVTMLGIIYWTFRPGSRAAYEKNARLTVE
jgi:cbb3-type cytochrome oxidase subunit 3